MLTTCPTIHTDYALALIVGACGGIGGAVTLGLVLVCGQRVAEWVMDWWQGIG